MMTTLRRIVRRMAGRNGGHPASPITHLPSDLSPERFQRKRRNAARDVREAQAAVDDFTWSLEQAMRGHAPRCRS